MNEVVSKTARVGRSKRSIATRWMVNTLSVIALLLIIANVIIYYFMRK